MVIEVCVDSIGAALMAQELGANRVELCADLLEDGITPSYGTIVVAKQLLSIPIRVMIRPRGGSFCYSPAEREIMCRDIVACKELQVDGVVLGCLNSSAAIDYGFLLDMVNLAHPLTVVFHKAFDTLNDLPVQLETLISAGVDAVLTSGGAPTALDGAAIINELVSKSNGRIKVIAAGKISKDNFVEVLSKVNTDEFHGRSIVGSLTNL